METYTDIVAEAARGCEVVSDSRKAAGGCIFVAVQGASEDGTRYVKDAVAKGARYIVVGQSALEAARTACGAGCSAVFVPVEDTRMALSELAAARYHTASHAMRVIAITGTNGKTTCSYLLERLFTSLGEKVGVMGTVSYRWPGHSIPAPLTTPDPLSVHANLAAMAEAGCTVCVMETSSHALEQKRVQHVPFVGACFTQLTQDHLDYHGDMETYFKAKLHLFTDVPRADKACALNADDPYGVRMLKLCPGAVSYGFGACPEGQDPARHLHAELLSQSVHGVKLAMRFGDRSWTLESPLIGLFNAENLTTVQAMALALGVDPDAFGALSGFGGVSGRLERVDNAAGRHVFVDYAHTPDALVNVLKALRGAGFKRIVTVFGCGGDRDRTKRPLMGEAVASLSDVAVLTSDNPRTEDPQAIIADVLPGLKEARECHVDADRRKATELALSLLGPDDCLLIAGKGHEDYQIVGHTKHHYSDQETVRELLGAPRA